VRIDEELAYFAYDWLRSHDSGNGYAGHDGMRDVTLDGTYDLVALFAAIRTLFTLPSPATTETRPQDPTPDESAITRERVA
jgi:hypothetical protein